MAGTNHIIILAGAPEADSLIWDERSLLSEYQLPIQRFLENGLGRPYDGAQPTPPAASQPAKWRSVDMQTSRDAVQNPPPTQFLSFDHSTKPLPTGKDDPQGFLEHSIALLDNIDSSQLLPPTAAADGDTTLLTTTSLTTTETSFATTSSTIPTPSPVAPQHLTTPCTITNLKHIPSAHHINSLHPQTVTLNLLVAIIAISPARTVSLRRKYNAQMEIIELTVGDDTRAGFGVNFWLHPMESQPQHHHGTTELRQTLRNLRPGDVVLLRNVALSSFRDSVYGQSLPRRRFGSFNTTVAALGKDDGLEGLQQVGQAAAFRGKVARVREWSERFVEGPVRRETRSRTAKKKQIGGRSRAEELPPDTQD